jgi:hypothetical protein
VHWALGIGHWALGIGHRAWGIGHRASGIPHHAIEPLYLAQVTPACNGYNGYPSEGKRGFGIRHAREPIPRQKPGFLEK